MNREERACRDKNRHPNREAAMRVRHWMIRTYGMWHTRISVYRCTWCQQWHIGNDRRRMPKRKQW